MANRGFPALRPACFSLNLIITVHCADPEILERRYPVVLRRFCLRKGSGGAGQFKGGDGVIREVGCVDCATASNLDLLYGLFLRQGCVLAVSVQTVGRTDVC